MTEKEKNNGWIKIIDEDWLQFIYHFELPLDL
jgi:hypothetical protein